MNDNKKVNLVVNDNSGKNFYIDIDYEGCNDKYIAKELHLNYERCKSILINNGGSLYDGEMYFKTQQECQNAINEIYEYLGYNKENDNKTDKKDNVQNNNVCLTKEQFVHYISEIKKYRDIEDKINDIASEVDFFSFSFGNYENIIVNLLIDIFKDKENDWIGYFICELEFGNKYKDGSITFNNKIVRMSNAEELYDVLVDNLNSK